MDVRKAVIDWYWWRIMEIVMIRLQNGQVEPAEAAVKFLKQKPVSDHMAEVIVGFESDIYFGCGKYLEALPHYCKTWERSLRTGNNGFISLMRVRLLMIEKQVGPDLFSDQFESHTGKICVRPQDKEQIAG